MRRRTVSLLLAVLVAWPALALAAEPGPGPAPEADHPWSVSVGTGGGGLVEFVDAFSNGGAAGCGGSGACSPQRQGRVQLNLRVERELAGWLRAGLAWVYNGWTDAYTSGGTRVGSVDNTLHALVAGADLRWLRAGPLELHSGLAFGAHRWRQAGDGVGASPRGVQSGFAFQLRALGISAGSDRLRAFAELGLGFEGLLVGGVTVRF